MLNSFSFISVGFVASLFLAGHGLKAQQVPPKTEMVEVVDEYFGEKIVDPLRHLENLNDPSVKSFMKAQDRYARSMLADIDGRVEYLNRLKELESIQMSSVSSLYSVGGGLVFYKKRRRNENAFKLYAFDQTNNLETLLFDPADLERERGKPFAINFFVPSPDGKRVAYGVSPAGSEDAVLYLMDVQTRRVIDEPISRAEFADVSWLENGRGFYYHRLQETRSGSDRYENGKVYYHEIGTQVASDRLILESGLDPSVPIQADRQSPYVVASTVSPFALALIYEGVRRELSVYAKREGQHSKPWKQVCDASDGVVAAVAHGGHAYLLTNKDSPRYKVIRVDLANPEISKSQTIVEQGRAVIEAMYLRADALYLKLLDGGNSSILRVGLEDPANQSQLKLPFDGRVHVFAGEPTDQGLWFGMDSWVHPPVIFQFHPQGNSIIDSGVKKAAEFPGLENLVSKSVRVTTSDGTEVPLSITFDQSKIKLDGSNPTLLDGYGAYGIPTRPHFSSHRLAMLEKGVVLATAHVRGGGEYGTQWHEAGKLLNKPNSWKDFIACAEYLIESGYTSSEKLAVEGGSAGGILIGRAITDRPELFAAAHIAVGTMNMLRLEEQNGGRANTPEFGTVTTREGFKSLYQMDVFHHVDDNVAYPAVLFTHGANDPRVPVWESLKMTARFQAATASDAPVLLRVDYDAGHGVGSTAEQRRDQAADVFSFFMQQLGEVD